MVKRVVFGILGAALGFFIGWFLTEIINFPLMAIARVQLISDNIVIIVRIISTVSVAICGITSIDDDNYSASISQDSDDNTYFASGEEKRTHVFYDSEGIARNSNQGFYDGKGIYREQGDTYFDGKGITRKAGEGFYDAQGIFRKPGDTYYDGKGISRKP